MYKMEKYIKELNNEEFTMEPQYIYTGKTNVLTMLSIDMELQLFEDPGINNERCSRLFNIDTVTITFESLI